MEVDYVEALSNQEVPDYFAGPAMAKTITQETQVVFGPEQEEWKAAILAELQSFAKLGVYEVVSRAEVRGQEDSSRKTCVGCETKPRGRERKEEGSYRGLQQLPNSASG